MNINGIINSIVRQGNSLSGVPVRLTGSSSVATAQVEPPYGDMTRGGRRFGGGTQIIANGFAPVQAIPTTTAAACLYNADSAGAGLCLFIDYLNVMLLSGTPAAGLTLFAAIGKLTTPPTTMATGHGVSSLSGSVRSSRGLWSISQAVPAGLNWTALMSSLQPAAANVGQGDNPIDLGGRMIVPPGYALCLSILSGAGTTPIYGVSAQWSELETNGE